MERKRNKTHICFSVFLFFLFLIFTILTGQDAKRYPMFVKADNDKHFQNSVSLEKIGEGILIHEGKREISLGRTRRFLGGIGSSPPRCRSKCGNCTPCRPVHVPVPPGTPVTAEYYPEAWRCKCGNKLYIP